MSHAKAEQEFVTPRTQRIDSGLRGVQVVQAAPLEVAVGASLALSVPPAGQIWRSYYYSGSLRIAVRETTSASSTVHFLLSDHLGSTVSSVDSSGQAASQRYWAWGETRSGGGLPTSFQYTGQYKTEALGIYFYGARWYDASLSRWLQPDSIVPNPFNSLDWDRYSYARNNPINFNDPSGHSPCDVAGADPECNDPVVEYYAKINERKAQLVRYAQEPMIPMWLDTVAPYTPYSPFTIGPNLESYGNPYLDPALSWLEGLVPFIEFYGYAGDLTDILEFIGNYGTPVYKQWKGSLPGGTYVEGALGFGTQLIADLNDRSRIRTLREMGGRALAAGVEDGLTEAVSTPVGTLVGAAGAVCGPLAPICMGAAYLAGANGTTWFMDNIVWKPINYGIRFFRE